VCVCVMLLLFILTTETNLFFIQWWKVETTRCHLTKTAVVSTTRQVNQSSLVLKIIRPWPAVCLLKDDLTSEGFRKRKHFLQEMIILTYQQCQLPSCQHDQSSVCMWENQSTDRGMSVYVSILYVLASLHQMIT
jgi:hypothetical protein